MADPRFAFGPYVYDPSTATLRRDAILVAIGGRAAGVLRALLEADGGVVTRSELIARAWPGITVEESNLAVQIRTLRQTLGTMPDGEEWIATVPRVGYRLMRPPESTARSFDGKPSVAVLPFANLSSDPEQEFVADGVVEDLITALSRFRTFAVVARSSSFVYKGRTVDAREAARELGVRYLLEGSVRRSDDRIRVSAQLIDGATGAHLWAEKFDGAATDLFDFQDTITEAVIAFIEPQIRKAEVERARQKRPDSLGAWDLYVQALPLVHSGAVADWTRALVLLDRAIALDPLYAPALTLAAWAHNRRNHWGGPGLPDHEADVEAAFSLSERSLAADPDDALGLALHGWLHIHYRLGFSMLDLLKRAVSLNPNNISVLDLAAVAHLRAGEFDDTLSISTRALELSPGAPQRWVFMMHIAGVYNATGRYAEGIDFAKRVVELEPAYVNAHLSLAISYAQLGRNGEARHEVETAVRMRPDVTIGALMSDRMRYPERVANWIEGLRKAGLPEG